MRVLVEHKPIETVRDEERVDRIVHMLAATKYAAPIGHIGQTSVFTLDGKAYVVGSTTVEVWDHFVLMDASRNGVVDLKRY